MIIFENIVVEIEVWTYIMIVSLFHALIFLQFLYDGGWNRKQHQKKEK